jgi:uncharacterized membrane protein
MRKNQGRDLVFKMCVTAVFAALDYVVTAFVRIPIPVNEGAGYLNLSDVFVFVLAAFLDPWTGGIVGGLAGMASDFTAGFGYFALFTLLIKFIEGIAAGFLFRLFQGKKENTRGSLLWKSLVAFLLGGLLMGAMYMIPDYITYIYTGSVGAETSSLGLLPIYLDLGLNCLQGTVNAILASIVLTGLYGVRSLADRHSSSKEAYEEIRVEKKDAAAEAEKSNQEGK